MPCVDSYWVLPDAHTAFSENGLKKSIRRRNQIVFKADETQWKVRQKRDL